LGRHTSRIASLCLGGFLACRETHSLHCFSPLFSSPQSAPKKLKFLPVTTSSSKAFQSAGHARRGGESVYGVPPGGVFELAPHQARNARPYALRRDGAGAPGPVPRRGPHATHLFSIQSMALRTHRRTRGGSSSARTPRGEFYQYYRYDLDSGDATLLTDGKSRNTSAVFSNSGDRLVYSSTRRNGKDTDLYVLKPTDRSSDRLLAQLEGSGWQALDWSPDDRTLLVLEFISATRATYAVRCGDRAAHAAHAKGGTEPVFLRRGGRFSRNGKGCMSRRTATRSFTGSRTWTSRRRSTPLAGHITWGIEDFDLSRDGKWLAFVTNEDGVSVLHVLETATGQERPVPKFPVGVIGGLQWHANGTELGVTFESVRTPADAYSYNVTTGAVERWTYSETGGLNTATFPEPELVRWKSFDGRTISGFLYVRPRASPASARSP